MQSAFYIYIREGQARDEVGSRGEDRANTYGDVTDEVLDSLLDQEGLEVDPVDRLEGDIPLHKAVRFANGLAEGEWGVGVELVELLLDAGADPRYVLALPCFSFFLSFLLFGIHFPCNYCMYRQRQRRLSLFLLTA